LEEECHIRIDEYDYPGNCLLTDYRISFRPRKTNNGLQLSNFPKDYFDIPLFFIAKIEKNVDKKLVRKYLLEITSKDNRVMKLLLNVESKKFYGTLCTLTNPKDCSGYTSYALKYREYHPCNIDGWSRYDPIKEFQRQGVVLLDEGNFNTNSKDLIKIKSMTITSDVKFRITFANSHYSICSTYPEIIIVPKSIQDDELKEAAAFRTKSRIPTLCYFNRTNNSSLWRSSQTKSGLTNSRNLIDEKLLKAITDLSTDPNKLIIYDARPYFNAQANRFKGAGFENIDNYHRAEICFCEIDNIHSVRNSYIKINSLCTNTKFLENKKFLSNLEATGWSEFTYQIIKAAVDVANSLKKGYSVLVHCSDGWDRSSQLTSLSQLLTDPFYRTLDGFIVLIEKEWLSFGHQFGLRNGLYNPKDHSEDEKSPVFFQWLDCVHQFVYQFPHLFEFNMDLLIFIAYHINSCKYGTFIFNSDKERSDRGAKNKTVSIWTDVLENKNFFSNPFYNPGLTSKYILPNFAFYKIRFWEEYFLRYLHFNQNFSKFYNTNGGKFRKNNDSSDLVQMELNKFISAPLKTKINSNYQFLEQDKRSDMEIMKIQHEEIQKLNQTIKEISSKILFKINDFNELSAESKEIITNINKGEFYEEEGYVVIRTSNYEDS
jgi:hypothetical protein